MNSQNYKQKFIPPLLILFLSYTAWSIRFIQDDAFISLRYAKNLAEGWGLVYNHGERVEGYTNFLWTVIISLPHFLNLDPLNFVYITGVLLFAVSLSLVYNISKHFTLNNIYCILVIFLTGTNFTFLSYATGGLETQLVAALLLSSISLSLSIENAFSKIKILLLSLMLTALILTRPDCIIFIFIMVSYFLYTNLKEKDLIRRFSLLIIPFMSLLTIYLVVKYNYYGDIIPNTIYAKVTSKTSITFGLYYLYEFFKSYWLIPVIVFVIYILLKKSNINRRIIFLFSLIAGMCGFVIYVGGDFMEFRFLVPVIPLFFIITGKALELANNKVVVSFVIVIILAGSVSHAYLFKSENEHKLLSIKELHAQIYADNFNWAGIGKKLRELFPYRDITIAITAAGAIPYYSELKTIDMHGLNDMWIAKNGKIISDRPGHQRLATIEYLLLRKVNIIIGHPFIMWESYSIKDITPNQFKNYFQYGVDEIPKSARIVKIPVTNRHSLFFIYLLPDKSIEEVIKRKKIESMSLLTFSEQLTDK